MNLLVTAGLSDAKLATKLVGLTHCPRVREVIVVRRRPLEAALPKVRQITPRGLWACTRPLYELWRLAALRRLARSESPSAIIGIQLQFHGVQAAWAGLRAGVPVVLAITGSDVYRGLSAFAAGPWLRWAVRRAGAVAVLGERSRRLLAACGVAARRLIEIQNWQDPSRFAPREQEKRWDVLFVGRLDARKRVDALIEAVAALRPRLPGLRLGIVGQGRERGRLERLARRLGLAGHVDFLGEQRAVEESLRSARVFALASESEGVPAAAVEAMFCGLPAVLTDVGDVGSVFEHERNALLVPPGDLAALAEALARLLTDSRLEERLRQGALAARQAYLERWDIAGQVRAWETALAVAQSK